MSPVYGLTCMMPLVPSAYDTRTASANWDLTGLAMLRTMASGRALFTAARISS